MSREVYVVVGAPDNEVTLVAAGNPKRAKQMIQARLRELGHHSVRNADLHLVPTGLRTAARWHRRR